jgi:hypothetical protein
VLRTCFPNRLLLTRRAMSYGMSLPTLKNRLMPLAVFGKMSRIGPSFFRREDLFRLFR